MTNTEYITTDERNPRLFLIKQGIVPKYTTISFLTTTNGAKLIRLADDHRDYLNQHGFGLEPFTGTVTLASGAASLLKQFRNFRG